jgi:hypothetical protein
MLKPSFSFNFSTDTNEDGVSVDTQDIGATSLIQNSHGPIYQRNKQIGTFSFSRTIFETNSTDTNKIYDAIGQASFRFINGSTLQSNLTCPMRKLPNGTYVGAPPVIIDQIDGGTGKYLNANGFIKVLVNNINLQRTVQVFLKKSQ